MKFSKIAIFILMCFFLFSCKSEEKIVIYAYDSFVSGAGTEIVNSFYEKTGIKTKLVGCGDIMHAITRTMAESNDPQGDVVIGIDNLLVNVFDNLELFFQEYKPESGDWIIPQYMQVPYKDKWLFTPYDSGSFAVMFDTDSGLPEPKTIWDLTKPEYKNKIILIDPLNNCVGVGFIAWIDAILGDKMETFFQQLRPNVLNMCNSWSTGYDLFTNAGVPMTISYTTSSAYHHREGQNRFISCNFGEGGVYQIECAAIIKNCKHFDYAKKFVDYLIEEDAQKVLPETQWMYPINENVTLPSSFEKIKDKPKKLEISKDLPQKVEQAIKALYQ